MAPNLRGRADRRRPAYAGCGRTGPSTEGMWTSVPPSGWKDGVHDGDERRTGTRRGRTAAGRMPRRSRCAGPTWTRTPTSTTCSSCACSRTRESSPSATGSTAGERATRRCSTRACSCRVTRSSTAGPSASGTRPSRSRCGSRGSVGRVSTSPTSSPTLTAWATVSDRSTPSRRPSSRSTTSRARRPAHAPRRACVGAGPRRRACAVPEAASVTGTRAHRLRRPARARRPRHLPRPREPGQPRRRRAPPGARRPARHDRRGHRGDRAHGRRHGARDARRHDRTVRRGRHDRVDRVRQRPSGARRGTAALSVPPTTVRAPWSGLTPPRDGWEPVGQLDGQVIESIALQGISQVAEGTPANAGGHAVDSLRRRTWGAMSDTVPPIAAGLAFGAHVLGFTAAGEGASIAAHGRWTRLSTSRGHVLVR